MNAGVQVAQSQRYTLGVALTDAQIAELKTDIVWLVKQTVTLADSSAPLVKQAEQAWAYRSYLRQGVRDGMSNRSLAVQLGKDRPHLSWQDIIEKYSQKYFGNYLWNKIINAAQRSNPEVTKT